MTDLPEARRTLRTTAAIGAAWLYLAAGAWGVTYPDGEVAGPMIVLNNNGGWSWFEDERAIVDVQGGMLVVSSVAHAHGDGPASRHGNVEVASLDLNSGSVAGPVALSTLSDTATADDHNSAAMLLRPDGRYLAVYAQHNADSLTRYRISTNPADISTWEPERTFDNGARTTYSNLMRLSGEGGRIYNITRTLDLDPHILTSDDRGATWSAAGRLLDWPAPKSNPKYTGRDGSRPYLKYVSNGVDEIHFITSEDHPRAFDNSIYHGVVKQRRVHDSLGRAIDGNAFDGVAKKPTDYTVVFNADASSLGFAWPNDLALDAEGRPYGVFTARVNNDAMDHRFLFARFDGMKWRVNDVAAAGGYLATSEDDYTGLAALDPSNPARLFISTKVDPRTSVATSHYEIYEGVTTNGAEAWSWRPITTGSTVDNLRPIVPQWDRDHTALLWLRGAYTAYTDYDLDVVALTTLAPIQAKSDGADQE